MDPKRKAVMDYLNRKKKKKAKEEEDESLFDKAKAMLKKSWEGESMSDSINRVGAKRRKKRSK